MRNLSIALILHKKIRTTLPKAKEARKFVERLVTYAKHGDVHGRRLILKKIQGNRAKQIANILIHDIAPIYKDRNGGYTRLIKLNNRKNDNASISLIEFVDMSPNVDINTEGEKDKGDSKE